MNNLMNTIVALCKKHNIKYNLSERQISYNSNGKFFVYTFEKDYEEFSLCHSVYDYEEEDYISYWKVERFAKGEMTLKACKAIADSIA